MTLVLLEKGLVLEGSNPKIEDKQVPGIYIYIYTHDFFVYMLQRRHLPWRGEIPRDCPGLSTP